MRQAICLAIAAAIGMGAQAQNLSGNSVKIGVMTDLSGAYSDLGGQGSIIAAKMAVADFSKDGRLFGRKIELVSADHQNKADIASNKAREWFDRDNVDVVVDLVNSTAALAVMDVAEKKNKLTLVSGAGAMAITNERCSPNNVHWAYDLYPIVNSLPTAMAKGGKKRWFFITVDYGAGHYAEAKASEALKAAGGQVVGAVRHPFGTTTDFSSYLLRAQASKADVIALANTGQEAINSIRQAAEFGIAGSRQTLVPLLMFINDIHALGLAATQGVNLVEAFYWNKDATTRAWSRRFFEQHKRMPNAIHAGVYSSVLNYLKAVQAAGTDDTQSVLKQLRGMEISDGLFKGRIRADGRLMHDMLLVEVKRPWESREPWDYYHIKAVIPAEDGAQPLSQSKCKLVH